MIIRADGLGGVLHKAESKDGGKTWPELAGITQIPNPGSKARLYPLGGDTVAILHNPNTKHRHPMALRISFDGMKTWPYQRIIQAESCDGPKGKMNYPDGFVSKDKQWLHFAFDDNRRRAVHYSAKLPPLPWTRSSSIMPDGVAWIRGRPAPRGNRVAPTGLRPCEPAQKLATEPLPAEAGRFEENRGYGLKSYAHDLGYCQHNPPLLPIIADRLLHPG